MNSNLESISSNRAKIGMSGADLEFYESGYKTSLQIPEYVNKLGLDCFEYSFGKGVRLSSETRNAMRDVFLEGGVEISVHAPYFINFANPDEEKIQKTFMYLYDSCVAARDLGAKRVVFHPGAYLKNDKETAFGITEKNFGRFLETYDSFLVNNGIFVCPETMGKSSQVGEVEEVAILSSMHSNVLPCIDFGHINARYQGILRTKADYQEIFDTLAKHIDEQKISNMHVHFSKVKYGPKGELKHLTFEDTDYGPEFEPLAEIYAERGFTPYIVSESDGTQGKDAVYMKKVYYNYIKK